MNHFPDAEDPWEQRDLQAKPHMLDEDPWGLCSHDIYDYYLRRHWLSYGVLRAWREVLGWSQKQTIAEHQKYLSPDISDALDEKTYQRWEWGKTQPRSMNFLALRQMLLDVREYYWVKPWAHFVEPEGLHLVMWVFARSRRDQPMHWVLVHPRTYQVAQGAIPFRVYKHPRRPGWGNTYIFERWNKNAYALGRALALNEAYEKAWKTVRIWEPERATRMEVGGEMQFLENKLFVPL